jgi:hypothetical protein
MHGIPISVHARKALVAVNKEGTYHIEPVVPFTEPPD